MFIIDALVSFGNWFWGIPLLMLCGIGGIFLNCMTGFVQFRHLKYVNSQTSVRCSPETTRAKEPYPRLRLPAQRSPQPSAHLTSSAFL